MSLTQYCSFINNHVGKAAGRMFNPPPHCEILRTPMHSSMVYIRWCLAALEPLRRSSAPANGDALREELYSIHRNYSVVSTSA